MIQTQPQRADYYSLFMRTATSGGLYVGIFREEAVLAFLRFLESAAMNCFSQIEEYVKNNFAPEQQQTAIVVALNTVKTWNSKTQDEEANKVIQEYPQIENVYKASIMIYIRDTFKHQNGGENLKIRIPQFRDFFFSFLRAIALDPYVQSAEYFRGSKIMERKLVHMDALRTSLEECIRQNIFENPFFIAICAGLVTMMILILLNPPFIQKKVDNPIHKSSPDLVKILIYSLIAAATVYVLPILMYRATCNKSPIK